MNTAQLKAMREMANGMQRETYDVIDPRTGIILAKDVAYEIAKNITDNNEHLVMAK